MDLSLKMVVAGASESQIHLVTVCLNYITNRKTQGTNCSLGFFRCVFFHNFVRNICANSIYDTNKKTTVLLTTEEEIRNIYREMFTLEEEGV